MKELIYMIESQPVGPVNKARIVLLSTDADFAQSVRSAFGADVRFEFAVVEDWLRGGRADLAVDGAAIVIIDLNNAGQEELSRLQRSEEHTSELQSLRH